MKQVTVRIEDDLNDWLNENFPHGFKQIFVEKCFLSLKLLVEKGKVDNMTRAGLKSVIKTIQEEINED